MDLSSIDLQMYIKSINEDQHIMGANDKACIIQKCMRGYALRKDLASLKDGYSFSILTDRINRYNEGLLHIKETNELINKGMNKETKKKKIRNDNFPSDISENIAKFAICKKYKIMPSWDCKGDLTMMNKQLEIKGFMSNGPLSFGPKEPWSTIYFVDALDTHNCNYKVFEIALTNLSDEWRNIIISGKDTFCEDCIIPSDLGSLKINELKELCTKRGLHKTGNKKKLIDSILYGKIGSGLNPKLTFGDIADADKRGKLRAPFYETIQPQISNYCELIFSGHINELA